MNPRDDFETDVFPTSAGNLEITFLGHGSLMMVFKGMNLYIDPYSKVADYSKLPAADMILLTHEHMDHLDRAALDSIRTENTKLIMTEACARQVSGGIVMANGDANTILEVHIEAVPAYNILHKRPTGDPFHPPGMGNGYILTFGDFRVYIAGDTENIPEMSQVQDIDCAFLPMNLPYTMTPEMVAEAARTIRPKVLYPYHYGSTDTSRILSLLRDEPDIEVRIRKLS